MANDPLKTMAFKKMQFVLVFVASPFISIPGLTAKELLVYFDDDGNGALSAAELATVFRLSKTVSEKREGKRSEEARSLF